MDDPKGTSIIKPENVPKRGLENKKQILRKEREN